MKLTAKFIEGITTAGRYYDDAAPGLFVLAQERMGRVRLSFVQRLTVNGKRVDIGLGSPRFGATTLTEARRRAMANWRIARNGGDPRAGKRVVPSFADGLDAVLAIQRGAWRNGGKSEGQWRASLRDYAGALMPKAVDAIGPADVLAVLTPIWNTKRETARRVRQRIGAVMKWSIAEGHRESNPVDAIGAALPKNGVHKAHHKALPYAAVSGALAAVRESQAWAGTKAAFEFLVLTAARSGEVRGMRWREVDLDAAIWTVPGERMKAARPHRVPLSPRALDVLRDARALSGGAPDALVFPAPRGGMLSDATMGKILKDRGIDAVPHGFRSSFREWAAERTNIPREVAEEALAHVNPNRVEAAYQRSDLFERRRDLMATWAGYLAAESASVVPLGGRG